MWSIALYRGTIRCFSLYVIVLLISPRIQCIPENADKPTLIEFFVTTHTNVPLLGCRACESLGLVKRVCEVSREKPLTSDILMKAYEDVFTGVGELENP